MKIGFYVAWPIRNARGNFVGDSLVAETLCKQLRKLEGVESAKVYAVDVPVDSRLDVMVYINGSMPVKEWADKHILYWQSGYGDIIEERFSRFYPRNYDGYMFFSKHLLEWHLSTGRNGIYVPFCADTTFYYPRQPEAKFAFEVTYIGNNIKGTENTMCYLYPALDFDFALYGNWRMRKVEEFPFETPTYRKTFQKISKGRIPEDDVPTLYSSTKIMLNTNIQQSKDLGVISLRTYQVLACKGFLISDPLPSPEMKELKGKVVFTEGYDDLRDKIRYYLEHEDERREIAERGYEYVTSESRSAKILAERVLTYIKEV